MLLSSRRGGSKGVFSDEEEERISYLKLINYIWETHPYNSFGISDVTSVAPTSSIRAKDKKSFGICDTVGSLNICCRNKKKEKVTNLAQELGVGPSLFLMQTKSMAFLFFLLSILYVPLIAIYITGSPDVNDDFLNENIFVHSSMGHLSSSQLSC